MTHHEGFKNPDQQTGKIKTLDRAPSRFSNILNTLRMAARTSPLLVGLLGGASVASCSSVTVEPSPASTTEGCSPIPDCPDLNISIYGNTGDYHNFYNESDRWERVDPSTGEIYKVCEPVPRNFCEEGQTPQTDGCELPVCENVQTCDPIPTRKSWDSGYIRLDRANFSVYPISCEILGYLQNDVINHQVIFDNVPDCKPGEQPVQGETYLTCDPIPTCEETKIIPYCRELPRCAPGQSPVVCEDNGPGFSYHDDCIDQVGKYGCFFQTYSLDLYQYSEELCKLEFDPSINENVYRMPAMRIQCLPTPECQPGEEPQNSTLYTTIDCGTWGTFQSAFSIAASCDPIKSCNQ